MTWLFLSSRNSRGFTPRKLKTACPNWKRKNSLISNPLIKGCELSYKWKLFEKLQLAVFQPNNNWAPSLSFFFFFLQNLSCGIVSKDPRAPPRHPHIAYYRTPNILINLMISLLYLLVCTTHRFAEPQYLGIRNTLLCG